MIVGYHVIFGAYGFWLPNDPRGSWSEFVGSWELFRHGSATKTDERRSVAHRPHDRTTRLAAKTALQRPAAQFTGEQARAVGIGFAKYAAKAKLSIWACSIMPDHVHLVLGRHRLQVESLVVQLKGEATGVLLAKGLHPFVAPDEVPTSVPKAFARGEWKVFLDVDDLDRAIRYVEQNPVKAGKPVQYWSFVTPYIDPEAGTPGNNEDV